MSVEFGYPIDIKRSLPTLEKKFPLEMGILRIGGVYPGERNEGTRNPYTNELDKEYFGNVGEHCVAVASCAEAIANSIPNIDPDVKKTITARALVHDATKRYEIMRRNAVREGKIDNAYSPQAYETIKPLLKKQGVAEDIISYMASAGNETGHNSLPQFVKIVDGEPVLQTHDNLAEMIVHHADDMTFTPIVPTGEDAETFFLTVPERMKISNFQERYPFLYKEGFGFNNEGCPIIVSDVHQHEEGLNHVKNYADWQKWVAQRIASHLTRLITHDEKNDPQSFIKNLVNQGIRNPQ